MKSTYLALALTAFSVPTSGFASVILLNDTFEQEHFGLNHPTFVNWTVTAGSVDIVGPGFFSNLATSHAVDLDGTTRNQNPAGQITTKLTFAPGHYRFAFDLGGSKRLDTNVVNVHFGNFSQNFTLASNVAIATHTFDFNLLSASKLSFTNLGVSDFKGLILDNVQVSAVPEPTTWAMMLVGFAGLGFLFSGRRRALGA